MACAVSDTCPERRRSRAPGRFRPLPGSLGLGLLRLFGVGRLHPLPLSPWNRIRSTPDALAKPTIG